MVAIPMHQTYSAIEHKMGALEIAFGSPKAITFDRRTKSFSIKETDVVSVRSTSHRCCAKHDPMLAVRVALKTMTKSRDKAETWD